MLWLPEFRRRPKKKSRIGMGRWVRVGLVVSHVERETLAFETGDTSQFVWSQDDGWIDQREMLAIRLCAITRLKSQYLPPPTRIQGSLSAGHSIRPRPMVAISENSPEAARNWVRSARSGSTCRPALQGAGDEREHGHPRDRRMRTAGAEVLNTRSQSGTKNSIQDVNATAQLLTPANTSSERGR